MRHLSLEKFFSLDRKFLVYNLVARNLKIKYRESFLGYLWTMLIPACQITIFYIIYEFVFKVSIPNYLVFLISGLLPWIFFSTTLLESMESIGGNGVLLNQMPIPIQVFPNTSALTNFINFISALPIMIIACYFSQLTLSWVQLLLIPLIILLYLQTLFLGFILSVAYVYFKDLRHITSLILQIWFYATPVIYDIKMVPYEMSKYLLTLNPISGFFVSTRSILFSEGIPTDSIQVFLVWTLFLLIVALLTLKKFGSGVVERI